MLKMAPPPSPSRFRDILIGTYVVGFFLFVLVNLGMEIRQDIVTYKPGVPHFDPRMMTPEAQKELFSLK